MGGILGMNPVPADEFKRDPSEAASFYPSTFSRKQGTPAMKGFKELKVDAPYSGDKKVLVLGTSKFLLPCTNGTFFSTGHHTTETFVPLYHLRNAGFSVDVATPAGEPLAMEEWTFPMAVGYEDELRQVQSSLKDQLENPKKFEDIEESLESYAAIFLPGGHGPIIDLHTYESLGKLLRSANAKEITTIALCHGPSALRAGAVGGKFPYEGYKMCVFPDSMDKMSPKFGYLPGYLPEENWCEAQLKALGCQIQNQKMDDSVFIDRELITGTSQQSAQKLSEAAVKALGVKFDFKLLCESENREAGRCFS